MCRARRARTASAARVLPAPTRTRRRIRLLRAFRAPRPSSRTSLARHRARHVMPATSASPAARLSRFARSALRAATVCGPSARLAASRAALGRRRAHPAAARSSRTRRARAHALRAPLASIAPRHRSRLCARLVSAALVPVVHVCSALPVPSRIFLGKAAASLVPMLPQVPHRV